MLEFLKFYETNDRCVVPILEKFTYKTLANYLFAVGGGLASIVIALSAYFWTANPPLPLDNRFLAVAVVLVVASLFFCGDVIWLSFIRKFL